MKTSIRGVLLLALSASLAACEGGDDGSLVARAAGNAFTVPEAVELLAGTELPNEPQVVSTLASLWVDYTLLATAVAEDSTLASLDVSSLIDQQAEQDMILALRDSLVQPDTVVTEGDVQSRFAESSPGAEIHARHILLAFPPQATPAQRDSVQQLAASLRQRLVVGEDFAEMARAFSADPGSAAGGGDLGWFGRNQMVRPLEDAAFALEPGGLSEVVESPYGLHIIRVDETKIPTMEDVRPNLVTQIQQERIQVAESTFVAAIQEAADIQVEEGAAELVRQIAENPSARLSGRARARTLVSYTDGEVTVGEFRSFVQTRAPEFRFQLQTAADQLIEDNLLVGLAQRELLVARAATEGFGVPDARRDSLALDLRGRLIEAARVLELQSVTPQAGETAEQAVERQVTQVLREMLTNQREVLPLDSFSFMLREQYEAQVFPSGVERAVARIQEVRGPEVPAEGMPPGMDPNMTPPPEGGVPPTVLPTDSAG